LEKTTFKKLLDEIDIKVENLFNAWSNYSHRTCSFSLCNLF
jgi:hypothetical protein